MSTTHETQAPSPRELKAIIDAERTGLPFLVWRDGAGEQHILMLEPGRQVTVGRREHSDVPLTWDNQVSRVHALIEPVGDSWALVDDGLSRNGSFVNGSQVHGQKRLDHKDSLCFGKSRVTYYAPAHDVGSESTARATDSPKAIPLTETQRKVLIALCRPVATSRSAVPATNPQIAADVHLSVDAVKAHLRVLFDRFGFGALPQNEKRGRLVATVLDSGILKPHDF
jgi:pSer/pThr/pTyr-binding forkhead associated (FHA) protein